MGVEMELQQIKYFLVLIEVKNFSHAARLCGVAQPSLSGAIRRFERSIGGDLFVRKPMRPTALALAIKPHCECLARTADLVRQEANRFLNKN